MLLSVLKSFRSMFFSGYVLLSQVTHLLFMFELRARQFWVVLFFFLFESSHACPVNMCEMRSLLFSRPKPNFLIRYVFEMKDFHAFCNSRW